MKTIARHASPLTGPDTTKFVTVKPIDAKHEVRVTRTHAAQTFDANLYRTDTGAIMVYGFGTGQGATPAAAVADLVAKFTRQAAWRDQAVKALQV